MTSLRNINDNSSQLKIILTWTIRITMLRIDNWLISCNDLKFKIAFWQFSFIFLSLEIKSLFFLKYFLYLIAQKLRFMYLITKLYRSTGSLSFNRDQIDSRCLNIFANVGTRFRSLPRATRIFWRDSNWWNCPRITIALKLWNRETILSIRSHFSIRLFIPIFSIPISLLM